ncbi:AsmA family protein [Pseudorhizobium endolithicum]|uniref:AsmA family protein n=2 Tax=Pseudorhizobium endolithicum TaxID=1191678 RepID=A0ABM8PY78_9HYPH|nr:AsmA family protein [Pseudorhizobium endolithicum]
MQAMARTRLTRIWRRWWRPVTLVIALLLLAALAVRLVAPVVVSTAAVREAMERTLADWTGHEVTVDGSPTLTFWPEPRIELSRVSIVKPAIKGVTVLARISSVSAEFNFLGAFRGRPAFEDFILSEPEIYLTRNEMGELNWMKEGLLGDAALNATPAGAAVSIDPSLDRDIGDVLIENGRLELRDSITGLDWMASGITGELHWPRFSEPASLEVTALLNGRQIDVDLASGQPLLLLSGREASLDLDLNSDLLLAQFSGRASLAEHGFVSGELGFSGTDAGAAAAWMGMPGSILENGQPFSFGAEVLTTEEALRFDRLRMSMNRMEATGIADLLFPAERPPRLTGTLAIDRLDLVALRPLMNPGRGSGSADQLLQGLELDLRLSAREVAAGSFSLAQAALSIVNENSQFRTDIVDGSLEGGRITGRMVTVSEPGEPKTDLQLAVRDANLEAIFQKLGVSGPIPVATGSLELSATLPQGEWERLQEGRGSFRITTAAGILPDLDPGTILHRVGNRTYLPLKNPEGQDFLYQRLDLSATFERGLAEIQSGVIEGDAINVTLSGLLPLDGGGLALSAMLTPAAAPTKSSALFIGGSVAEPVVITQIADPAGGR